MDLNFIRRVRKYKKDHRIKSKFDLICALDAIIDEEMSRLDGEIDLELVDKAVEISLRLRGIEAASHADTEEMLLDTGIGAPTSRCMKNSVKRASENVLLLTLPP